MPYILTMLIKVGILVALALPGFVMRKLKLMPNGTAEGLGNILLYVAIPFLILQNFQAVTYTSVILRGVLLSFAVAVIFHCLLIVISRIAFLRDKAESKRRAAEIASIFSNCGFLGIPILIVMMPELPEVVVYAVVFNAVFDYILFTYGVYEMTGDVKYVRLKKALINPITVVLALALPLFFCGVNLSLVAPEVMTAVNMLGGLATPLAMTVMGIRLAEISLKSIFTSLRLYPVSIIKLLLSPLAMFGLIELVKLVYPVSFALEASMLIMAAMPTATITIAFQDKYQPGSIDSSVYVLGTTAFAVGTIPLLALLISLL